MNSLIRFAALAVAAFISTPCATLADTAPTAAFTIIPPGHDDDLRVFAPGAAAIKGADALDAMRTADLVLWVAGNQFFAMEDVVHAFQAQHPMATVGVVTLPPGLELLGIQSGGFRYAGRDFPGRPDVFATLDLKPLQTLRDLKLASTYATYMHNELMLMVAQGNPKHITGIDDLGRPDVKSSLPNPLTEGIMTFYARPVLERHGLYAKLTGGKDCTACQPTPNAYFTAIHHRETPERLADGRADVGIVWKTEAAAAIARGAKVQAIPLPPQDSAHDTVAYYVTALRAAPSHATLAQAYCTFVTAPAGQAVYAHYGFAAAGDGERTNRPI